MNNIMAIIPCCYIFSLPMEDVKLVGAIDEGTSSARFILFRAGTDEIVCFHQIDVPTKYPQETWVEQDPLVIYDIVKSCINECVKQLQEIGGDVQVNY